MFEAPTHEMRPLVVLPSSLLSLAILPGMYGSKFPRNSGSYKRSIHCRSDISSDAVLYFTTMDIPTWLVVSLECSSESEGLSDSLSTRALHAFADLRSLTCSPGWLGRLGRIRCTAIFDLVQHAACQYHLRPVFVLLVALSLIFAIALAALSSLSHFVRSVTHATMHARPCHRLGFFQPNCFDHGALPWYGRNP
jgi:hypothetical protein